MTTISISSGLGYLWPSDLNGVSEFEPEIISNVKGSTSQFNGVTQTTEVPGSRWIFTCRWAALSGEESNAMMALIGSLRGGAKRIFVPWFFRREPLGTQRGAPTVNASGTAGKVLALSNCTIGATFKRGDAWGLATGQTVILEEDAIALSTSVLLRVSIPIRTTPPNGSVAEWDDPGMLMISGSPSNRVATMSGNQLKNVEIRFVEAF